VAPPPAPGPLRVDSHSLFSTPHLSHHTIPTLCHTSPHPHYYPFPPAYLFISPLGILCSSPRFHRVPNEYRVILKLSSPKLLTPPSDTNSPIFFYPSAAHHLPPPDHPHPAPRHANSLQRTCRDLRGGKVSYPEGAKGLTVPPLEVPLRPIHPPYTF